MSVEEEGVIDFIGVDQATGEVVLTISDHLDWTDPDRHLSLLQDKLNRYLAFVESGEIMEVYPSASGRQIRIDVVGQHEPASEATRFFDKVGVAIKQAGFRFETRVLSK